MKLIRRDDLEIQGLPGRGVQKAVGKDALSASKKMSMGYTRYAAEYGPMEPHQHAEEIVFILSSDRAYFRYGNSKDQLSERIPLEAGMTLHFPELEWHVFEYEDGGSLDILFFYGQVDNIRPEEILQNK